MPFVMEFGFYNPMEKRGDLFFEGQWQKMAQLIVVLASLSLTVTTENQH